MKNVKVILLVQVLFLGILYIGLAIPLAAGKVAPNGAYGFKVAKTLSDENIWYQANAYFGNMMIWAGVSVVVLSLLCLFFRKRISSWVLIMATVLVPVIPIAIVIVKTLAFLEKL